MLAIRTTALALAFAMLAGCATNEPARRAPKTPPPPRKVFVDYSRNNPKSGWKNWPEPGDPEYQKVVLSRKLKSNDRGDRFPDFDDAATFFVDDHGDGVRVYVGRRIARTQFFPEFCEVTSADTPPAFQGTAWETCEFLHEASQAESPNPATPSPESGR